MTRGSFVLKIIIKKKVSQLTASEAQYKNENAQENLSFICDSYLIGKAFSHHQSDVGGCMCGSAKGFALVVAKQ